eukprot:SAG11_NODE_772_length_7254_cov_1.857582_2_plen_139_part_00
MQGCDLDIPVIALGGGTLEGWEPAEDAGKTDFDVLWETLQSAEPLSTEHLQPFDGAAWRQFEAVIQARDEAMARAAAATAYMSVAVKLAVVLGFFFWRGFLLPSWISIFFLNLPGTSFDELLVRLAPLGPSSTEHIST